jgi:4-amino-4-deoxy-L-arabinose transferase-like glycosyltransferase
VSNVSPPSGRDPDWPRFVRRGAVLVCVLGAVLTAALSLVPYEHLKDHVDAFTVDRDADVSRTEFDGIVWRMRVVAVGLGLLAVALVAFAAAIDRVVSEVGRSWWSNVRRAPSLLKSWVAREPRATVLAGAAIIVTAVAVRVAYLDVPMRYDEATTYNNFVSKPLYVALANYATPNNHLLHTFLAKVSVSVFGNEPWAVRLPALVAGIALVPATFALTRVLYGRIAALLAAALVAASSTLVEYSTNARGYTLVALATVVVLIAAARAVEDDTVGAWAAIAAVGALGLYAVPIMIYPLGGTFVWIVVSGWLADRPLRPLLTRLGAAALAATILTLLLYAPVYAASGVRSVTANEFVEPRTWSTFFDLFPGHVSDTVGTWTRDLPFLASMLLGVGLLAGIAATPWVSRFPVPVLLAVAVWALPVIALQRVVPYTRVWLFLVPLAAATTAGVYGWLLERRTWSARAGPAIAAVVAVGGSLLVLSADSVRESRETGGLLDAPAIAAFLAERLEPEDRILATGSDTILEYYLERDGIDAGRLLYTADPSARTYVVVNVLGGQTIDDLLAQLNAPGDVGSPELLTSFESGRVYLVRSPA